MNLINQITIKQAIEIYLEWKKSHTEKAWQAYEIRLDRFEAYLAKKYDKTKLSEVSADDIVEFHNHMSQRYAPATVAYSARILRNFFYFHKGRNNTHLNPKEIIPIRFINADKEIVEEEDFEEMTAILDENYIPDLQKKLVLHILWQTGMRLSELLDIKLADINEQGSDGMRTAKVKTRKTQRYNLVVWGTDTDDLLIKYLGWRLITEHPTDLLFISTYKHRKTNQGLNPKTVQRWVSQLSKRAMLDKKLTPHSFRHGKAHFILDNGGTAVDVQAVLRHRNLNSSLNYMQLNQSRYLKTASKFIKTSKQSIPGLQPTPFSRPIPQVG